MQTAQGKLLIRSAMLSSMALLAGCFMGGGENDGRPQPKPEHMTVQLPGADKDAPLRLARISTKTGEILILEPDGSVTSMDLDSEEGRDAFAISEADLAALNANLDLDLGYGGAVAANRPREKTAQEKALEEFAKRTQPALPEWKEGTEVAAEDFIGTRVVTLNDGGKGDLVEVTANLREGVDADIAFSYATCALAGWAKTSGTKYGRHIRTLQQERDGKLLVGAAFTISDEKPLGLRVMETNQTLRECKARGIPAA